MLYLRRVSEVLHHAFDLSYSLLQREYYLPGSGIFLYILLLISVHLINQPRVHFQVLRLRRLNQ